MMMNQWRMFDRSRRPRYSLVLGALSIVIASGCGSSDGTSSEGQATTPASTPASTVVPSEATPPPSDAQPPPDTSDAERIPTMPLVDATVVGTTELGRGDLGFLVSDGEALWSSGRDGIVVRIDPDDGTIDEFDVGGDVIEGDLLPTVTDDSIWFSAIQGSHIVRLDRATLEFDAPIEIPEEPGLVIDGPGDQVWMEVTERPAGLLPVDPTNGTVGEKVTINAAGETLGGTAAFGSLWLPMYDDNEIVVLDEAAELVERVPAGVGPAYAREAFGEIWHPNWVDGTVDHIDPETLEVTTIDLNAAGDTVERPSAIVATSDAIWTRAGRLDDGRAIVFRIDPASGAIAGRRTIPGGLLADQVGGMSTIGDRLFVFDRAGRRLLELDTDQFTSVDPETPTASSVAESPEVAAIRDTIRTLLSTDTAPDAMAKAIVDGDRLRPQFDAFKQFFVDNLPGEAYEGDILSAAVDGDRAEIDFYVTVAGEPIVEPIEGVVVLEDGRWLLTADSFCRLIATGEIDCPTDLPE